MSETVETSKPDKATRKTALRVAVENCRTNPYDLLREYVLVAIDEEGGNKVQAAKRLNMHRRTLQRIVARP